MRLGDILRRLRPSGGSVEPFQIPAEPNETALAAPGSCSAAGGVRTDAADHRSFAADAHVLLSPNELGSLVVRLIKGYTTEQAVAPRPVYGIGKRWNITT